MRVAHKIALDPNTTQRSYFVRASGTARFAYNWALGAWKKQYQADRKPSEVCLRRQLNARKRGQYPWMFDVTKCAVQEAIIDLGAAFRGQLALDVAQKVRVINCHGGYLGHPAHRTRR